MDREELQRKADDKLLGRLQDQAAFEKELASDPELAKVLEDTGQAIEAIEAAEDIALKNRLQRLEKKLAKNKSPLKVVRDSETGGKVIPIRPPFWRRNLAAVAAAAVLLLSVGYFLLMPDAQISNNELLAANFEPFENIAVDLTRGNDPSPEELAFTAYENGEYERAARLLAGLGDEPAYRFYTAQAHLANQDYQAAKALLIQLIADPDFALQQESEWYLALAELGADQQEAAAELLRAISNTPDHPYREQAGKLLAEILTM